jgi:hypothetical protein
MTTDDTPRKDEDEDEPHIAQVVWVVRAPEPTIESIAEHLREIMDRTQAINRALHGIVRDMQQITLDQRALNDLLEALKREPVS